VLMEQAQFGQAAAALQKAGELYPANHPDRKRALELRHRSQRYVALDLRLPAILSGTEKPANATEQIELAEMCRFKEDYAAAARFYRDAFAAYPKLAEDVLARTHYAAAAAAAALAGCGQGKDANQLDEKERARWRRQALEWLRCDLTWWGKELDNGNGQARGKARRQMRYWQAEPAFAGVRTKDALARLPDVERKQWETLWSDVDAMLHRVSEPE
jgi:serine/threonine-protein kinase